MFKDILDSRKITCYRFAKDTGVSYTAVNEIYRGERTIEDCSLKIVKCFADTLNMSLDEFYEASTKRKSSLPRELYPYFSDGNPLHLDIVNDKAYVITHLLDNGGYKGLLFLTKTYSYEEIKGVGMTSRLLSPKAACFLKNVYHIKKSDMAIYSSKTKRKRG